MKNTLKNIQIHTIQRDTLFGKNVPIDIAVAKVKLVLAECAREEAILFGYLNQPTIIRYKGENGLVKGLGKYLQPVFVSETEKIKMGDWFVTKDGVLYNLNKNNDLNLLESDRKVVAMSKQISDQFLQSIINHDVENEDELLLEAEIMYQNSKMEKPRSVLLPSEWDDTVKKWNEIKLDIDSHVIIHIPQGKMYTEKELIAKCGEAYKDGALDMLEEEDNSEHTPNTLWDQNKVEWIKEHI